MVLGAPRRGKTSAVMIPAILAASGAVISTSTKPDVMRKTAAVRSELGQVWLFDPSASEKHLPPGVRRLCWSPVAAATTWDEALVMARAMTAATRVGSGTTNENHWTERAQATLAPLLYAANQAGLTIGDVVSWVQRHEVTQALEILGDCDAQAAVNALVGIERTDKKERSSIFSATAGVLSAYYSDAVRATAAHPNFDAARFVRSRDTIYITAPEQKQALCAPLIVGLLEEIRHAGYELWADEGLDGPASFWALDEIPNIAPIHDLPALISQAGGQNLQVMIGIQDLSQARERWGEHAADGFMTMFQTKVVLTGIGDPKTLESISLALGEYDREVVSHSLGYSEQDEFLSSPTYSDTVNYHTQRQRVLTPGEIGRLPEERGLLLRGNDWELLTLTNWFNTEPWRTLTSSTVPAAA